MPIKYQEDTVTVIVQVIPGVKSTAACFLDWLTDCYSKLSWDLLAPCQQEASVRSGFIFHGRLIVMPRFQAT